MGNKNNVLVGYFDNAQRFADLYNGYYYGGEPVIKPELLEDATEKYDAPIVKDDTKGVRSKAVERIRDIKKRYRGQMLRIIGIEDLDSVDYTLGVRNMEYDVLEYRNQLQQIKGQHSQRKDYPTDEERRCGFCRRDRLIPVNTLWLYHGSRKYDGPRSLKDMLDFADGADHSEINDYPVHLMCVEELEDLKVFHTQIRQLFMAMQCRDDKDALKRLFEQDDQFQALEPDTVEAISVALDSPGIWSKREKYISKEEGGTVIMCKAMEEWEAEAKDEGRKEGRNEGEMVAKIKQTMKKLAKNKTPEEIADALEEDITLIERICQAISDCGDDCTAEEVFHKLEG